ncbi:hypothetical protein C4J81_10875 [Deltaproteobacteria bacterium Smac51]|nr:hypothetical protein C4J81_10875 [Deltaproteobacteria bacterium Smac51]
MKKPMAKNGRKPGGRKPAKPAGPAQPKVRASLELTDNPRLAAFRALKETGEGRLPEEALESHCRLLSPRDLGLTTAIVYEVLRHQSLLNGLIRARLTSGRASDDLMLILRLGLAQLMFFSRLGDHAVVMETVALAKAVAPGRHGLVNAVLRGLIRDREAGLPWPPEIPETGDLVRDLAMLYSYQPWLVKMLLRDYNQEEAELLLASGNRHTPPTIRANPLKIGRAALAMNTSFPCSPTDLSPWGLTVEGFFGQPAEWPGFSEGLFAIQDEASQLAGLLAGNLGRAEVLDACAGLGGKGLSLACLNPEAAITCLDKDPAKLDSLKREAERLGCSENVRTESRDLTAEPLPQAAYDLVLVDAPCSGLGVIRRRPDLKWSKGEDDITRLAGLQQRLLLATADSVRPGGRLIFGVCSFSREEGPENVKKFLSARPDFAAAPPAAWPESLQPLLADDHTLTLLPHRQNTDGFFWAVFFKN